MHTDTRDVITNESLTQKKYGNFEKNQKARCIKTVADNFEICGVGFIESRCSPERDHYTQIRRARIAEPVIIIFAH